MSDKKYKVLALSGGGAHGDIIATFFSYLKTNRLLDGVDAITGASVGGMLTLAYAIGKTPEEVVSIFRSSVSKIFSKRWQARIWPLACPTYDNKTLDSVVETLVGDKRVGDIRKVYPDLSIFVGSVNVTDDKFKMYDNITGADDDVLLKDIAGQTSAAPSYFYGRDYKGKCMVDQGIVDNFGAISAATGLRHKKGVEFKDMDVLVMGCGKDVDTKDVATPKRYNNYSLLQICTNLIVPYVTFSNQCITEFWGKNMGFNSFQIFNPVTTECRMDDIDNLPSYEKQCQEHRAEFLEVWHTWLGK